MARYRLAVGTHDPEMLEAETDAAAIRAGADLILRRYNADLAGQPEEVVTLIGPGGPVTRWSERLDEFVARVPGLRPAASEALQTGDTNAPDCNGD